MRSAVNARETNENRDRQTRQTDPPVGENKDGKECGRSNDMPRWKRVKFGAQARAIPSLLGLDRWSRATRRNLDRAPRQPCDGKRDQHRHENARPFLVSAPPGDAGENKSECKMFRPIAKPAHIAHEIAHTWGLMARDEIADSIIQIKRSCDDHGNNHDADQPIKNSAALHNKVPVRFTGRYFEAAREINQLRVAVFGMPAFSGCRDVEHSADRSRRAALCRSVARDD